MYLVVGMVGGRGGWVGVMWIPQQLFRNKQRPRSYPCGKEVGGVVWVCNVGVK